MLNKEFLEKCMIIDELSPWKYLNIDTSVVIEIDDVAYALEIQNNIIKIYPNNLSSYLFLEYQESLKESQNLSLIDGLRKNLYNATNVYVFEYLYSSMLSSEVKNTYIQNGIQLNNNDLYCSFEYKEVNKELEILKENKALEIIEVIDELINLVNYIKTNKVSLKDNHIVFYNNNKIKFIKPQLFMVNLKNRIYFPIFEFKKNLKVIKRK